MKPEETSLCQFVFTPRIFFDNSSRSRAEWDLLSVAVIVVVVVASQKFFQFRKSFYKITFHHAY